MNHMLHGDDYPFGEGPDEYENEPDEEYFESHYYENRYDAWKEA